MAFIALASYRQDKDRIHTGHVAIKRDVSVRIPANYQFSLAVLHQPANEWTVGQDLHRLHDRANSRGCVLDLEPGHAVEKPVEIVEDFRREFDPCHAAG